MKKHTNKENNRNASNWPTESELYINTEKDTDSMLG
mgnify:CR=1 FL=1